MVLKFHLDIPFWCYRAKAPLSNLAKSFSVDEKGVFPYDFVNDRDINELDYIGKVPIFKYFSGALKVNM